jgi:hypothetical protein
VFAVGFCRRGSRAETRCMYLICGDCDVGSGGNGLNCLILRSEGCSLLIVNVADVGSEHTDVEFRYILRVSSRFEEEKKWVFVKSEKWKI